MQEKIEIKLDELRKKFGNVDITKSWFYAVLEEKHNQLNNDTYKVQPAIIKFEEKTAEELSKIKYRFTKEGLTLIKPELSVEWEKFINKNLSNPYYVNIIEAAFSMMRKIDSGVSFSDAENEVFIHEFDLSGFQLSVLQNIISIFFKNGDNYSDYLINKINKPNQKIYSI